MVMIYYKAFSLARIFEVDLEETFSLQHEPLCEVIEAATSSTYKVSAVLDKVVDWL